MEINRFDCIAELAYSSHGLRPELSYGSHFFQDLVESGIFYVAIFDGQEDVVFNPDRILREPNIIAEVSPSGANLAHVIHVAATRYGLDLSMRMNRVDMAAAIEAARSK